MATVNLIKCGIKMIVAPQVDPTCYNFPTTLFTYHFVEILKSADKALKALHGMKHGMAGEGRKRPIKTEVSTLFHRK